MIASNVKLFANGFSFIESIGDSTNKIPFTNIY